MDRSTHGAAERRELAARGRELPRSRFGVCGCATKGSAQSGARDAIVSLLVVACSLKQGVDAVSQGEKLLHLVFDGRVVPSSVLRKPSWRVRCQARSRTALTASGQPFSNTDPAPVSSTFGSSTALRAKWWISSANNGAMGARTER